MQFLYEDTTKTKRCNKYVYDIQDTLYILYDILYNVYMIIYYQRLIYTDIIYSLRKRERERENKKKHVFAFSWEPSLPATVFFFCVHHHSPGYLQQSFSTERWLGPVRMKQVGSKKGCYVRIYKHGLNKKHCISYTWISPEIDSLFINILQKIHLTSPVLHRFHWGVASIRDVRKRRDLQRNGGWPCGEVTNVHDRARGYRVLRVKCGFLVPKLEIWWTKFASGVSIRRFVLVCILYIYI